MANLIESKEPLRGVFWVLDDTNELLAYPFQSDKYISGISKSGVTYNHKKLWDEIKPNGNNKPYNYYPRGRVDFSNKGVPTIWINSNINLKNFLPEIRIKFGLTNEDVIVKYDNSEHYKCHLDPGWKPAK